MRTDLLSKRLFTAGCFGLPWLWIVHALYWRGQTTSSGEGGGENGENNEGLLNPDDHFTDEPTESSVEQIRQEAAKWVGRCQVGALIVTLMWIGWIVTSQVLYRNGSDIISAKWFMLNDDSAELTGW